MLKIAKVAAVALELVGFVVLAPGLSAQSQKPSACHVRLRLAEYQLKNIKDLSNPENIVWDARPPMDDSELRETEDASSICVVKENYNYILMWGHYDPAHPKNVLPEYYGQLFDSVAHDFANIKVETAEQLITASFAVIGVTGGLFSSFEAKDQRPLCDVRMAPVKFPENAEPDLKNISYNAPAVNAGLLQALEDESQICFDTQNYDYILSWNTAEPGFRGALWDRAGSHNFATMSAETADQLIVAMFFITKILGKPAAGSHGSSATTQPIVSSGRNSRFSSCRISLAIAGVFGSQPWQVLFGGLFPPQRTWLEKDARKKFPEICIDYQSPQFIFAWTQNTTVVPTFSSIWHPGGTAYYSGSVGGEHYSGYIQMPGYAETVPSEELSLTVYGYLFRVADGQLVWTEWREQGAFGSASRRVLQDAFKVLAKYAGQ